MVRYILIFLLLNLVSISYSQTRRSSTTTKVKNDGKSTENTASTSPKTTFLGDEEKKTKSTPPKKVEPEQTSKTTEMQDSKPLNTPSTDKVASASPVSQTKASAPVSNEDEVSFGSDAKKGNTTFDAARKESEKQAADVSAASAKSNTINNSSAIANGQVANNAIAARELKYKASDDKVEYYKQLRAKFEEEEKLRKEKEAAAAAVKAEKEEAIKAGRHLSEEEAPQFDKYRNGAKNDVAKKTSAEEDFKNIFK